MNNGTKENKMGVMPVNRLLITMAAPMALSMLIQALYNIVDSVFVSHVGEAALSAVSLAFPVQNVMMALSSGTAVGVNALLSRSLGSGHFDDADRYAGTGIFLFGAGALLLLLFGAFFSTGILPRRWTIPTLSIRNRYLSSSRVLPGFSGWSGRAAARLHGRTFYCMLTRAPARSSN
jgi:Na+-driven multidrug efflux pump